MAPTINDVQVVEPVLTNMMTAFRQNAERFDRSRVFPVVPVNTDSHVFQIHQKYWYHDTFAALRAGRPPLPVWTSASKLTPIKRCNGPITPSPMKCANATAPLDLETPVLIIWVKVAFA